MTDFDAIRMACDRCTSQSLLPVYARALESQKTRPLLRDEKAVSIAEALGRIPGREPRFYDMCSHYAFILRTLWFDRLIKDFIWRHPGGTVIDIGCGLDSTFERINPKTAKWYELDLPEVIDLRKCFFKERHNRKFISSSFLANDWQGKIICDDALLIVASGVFYYHDEKTIRKFLAKLSFMFPSFELLFNITSPAGVRAANRLLLRSGAGKSLLKWGISDFRTIAGWNPRLKLLGRYRLFHQECRVPLKVLIPGYISDLLAIECILHMKMRDNYRNYQRH